VIASTACFDKSLMQTVTRDNINPIERAEAVTAIMASTLHGLASPLAVIRESEKARVTTYSSKLLLQQ